MVETVQALAKEFGDFSHDVQSALSALNSFGGDATALSWVGQTAEAFKASFGPLPGRLQKLYISYGEASDALTAYWPKMQAAQNKADAALRQGQDAEVDVSRATGTANNAAGDLKTAQAGTDPKATADAQTAHDNAQKALSDAKGRLTALAAQAHQAHDDLQGAAKECAKALHHAQSDGIHNKHWWQHVGEILSEVGGQIADWAGEIGQIAAILAPVLNGIALLTVEIPGLDVVTASLAAADDLIVETAPEVMAAGTEIKATGDALQGHWGGLAMDAAAMFARSRMGGKGAGDEEPEGPLGGSGSSVSRLTNEEDGGSGLEDPDDEYGGDEEWDDEDDNRPFWDNGGDDGEDDDYSDYDQWGDEPNFEKGLRGDNTAHNKKGRWAMGQGGAMTPEQRRRVHDTMKDGMEGNDNLGLDDIIDIAQSELGD
ncbi:WXG100 family type VII secretion target [Catenulispora pinisilvae]|uniref:WXG100 family type VII secretion target n=1 Tax=Catenulispora pinisilvae TaxID=2705253 RepID=UPI0018925415|nr:hypothetical protein [Catenulispora pinisilvae]